MLKTVLALALSTGLVGCMLDDTSTIETEELAENPDVLVEDDGDGMTAGTTGIIENPADVPGRIPAPSQGGVHVNIEAVTTTDLGLVRGTDTTGVTATQEPAAQTHNMNHGVTGTQVGGQEIGDSCTGQPADCRTADPQKLAQ